MGALQATIEGRDKEASMASRSELRELANTFNQWVQACEDSFESIEELVDAVSLHRYRLAALESEATRMKNRYSDIDGQLEKILARVLKIEDSTEKLEAKVTPLYRQYLKQLQEEPKP